MKSKLLQTIKDWLIPPPLETRLTAAAVLEIARRHLNPDGQLFLPGAGPVVQDGRLVWKVVTHVGYRGGHDQVDVDDYTGEVIRTHHVEL